MNTASNFTLSAKNIMTKHTSVYMEPTKTTNVRQTTLISSTACHLELVFKLMIPTVMSFPGRCYVFVGISREFAPCLVTVWVPNYTCIIWVLLRGLSFPIQYTPFLSAISDLQIS